MLLEERIRGQTARTILRRRFRRRWIAPRRADPARQESAGPLAENRHPRELPPSESPCALDHQTLAPRRNLSDARPAWQSENQGHTLCGWPWLPEWKQPRHPRRLSWPTARASPRALSARRRFPLLSWLSDSCW